MHRFFVATLAIVASFAWSSFSTAQETSSEHSTDPRVERWIEDIDFLALELPKRHKDLFFQLPESEFRQSIENAKQDIPNKSDAQMQLELCQLVTAIGDGHTRINIDAKGFQYLPLHFVHCKDGLFIKDALAKHESLVGARLLSINDFEVSAIYDAMASMLAHDNDAYLKVLVPYYLNTSTMLDFAGIGTEGQPFRITVESDGGSETIEVERQSVAAMDAGPWVSAKESYALFEKRESEDYWTEWLPESKTLYMKYRRCNGFLKFGSLTAKTLDFLKSEDVDRLVIDMRLNGGGNSAIMDLFLLPLRGHPINAKGRLYAVIGRKTFSSAVLNSISLKQNTEAILVGLPSGGKPNHFGEVKRMKLPNSGLTVTYSTNYFKHFKGGDPESLEPDVTIEATFEQWRNGEDAVLDYILRQPLPNEE